MTRHEQTQRVLDRAVAEYGVPGIVVEVSDEHGTWFGAAGLADLDTGRPRERGEYLNFGSIGKSYTAATVLTLVAEGTLSLDDTVDKWLPGAADAHGNDGRRLTVRRLLNHTSGLFSTGLATRTAGRFIRSRWAEHRFDVWTVEELVALAVSEPPVAGPGETFMYSNGGYYLLGAIIEAATGRTHAEEVHRAVIAPLGLTDTYVRPAEETKYPEPHPRAYSKVFLREGVDPAAVTPENWPSLMEDPGLAPLDVTEMNTSLGHAAGGIVSTTGDMLRFYTALLRGTLLPPEQHEQLWTTVSTEGGSWLPNTRYGLGVHEETLPGGQVLRGGGGSDAGTCSYVRGTPDAGHLVVIHTNNDWCAFGVFAEILEAEFGRN